MVLKGLQMIAMMGFLLASCGSINSNSTTSTSCTTGTVQIQVTDASLTRICGCQVEANNQVYSSGQSLQCTAKAGAQVYFYFSSITTQHRIVMVGGGTTTSTATITPISTQSVQTGVIPLNSTGTFTFSDVYIPGLSGSFIVN